jgi:hypothetical protein
MSTSGGWVRWATSSFDAAEYCLDHDITFLATGTVADNGGGLDC